MALSIRTSKDTVTTFVIKPMEVENYSRHKNSPHQTAKLNSIIYGTLDPDIEEHITRSDGRTTIYYNEVQDDGSVIRKQK